MQAFSPGRRGAFRAYAGTDAAGRSWWKKKERLVDLEKVMFRKEDTMLVLGGELSLEEVKGPGKRLEVWWTEG